jgi:aminopeptidase-like protein
MADNSIRIVTEPQETSLVQRICFAPNEASVRLAYERDIAGLRTLDFNKVNWHLHSLHNPLGCGFAMVYIRAFEVPKSLVFC